VFFERKAYLMAQGIRQRVAALPPVAQDVLRVAAVVGRVVPPDLLAMVAERHAPSRPTSTPTTSRIRSCAN
jgi:predicted ATPase